jgi:hypothetical protein
VRNTRFSNEKSLSVRSAQEAMEWLRGRRDQLGWRAFYQVLEADAVSNATVYCLPSLNDQASFFQNLTNQACVGDELIGGTNFVREARLALYPPQGDRVDVEIEVVWEGGNGPETTVIRSSLREWR